MNKTVNINISGMVFHIDEDAYSVLHTYLQTLRGYFNNKAEQAEIMADIEARIAEMLSQKLQHEKMVVSMKHVEEVIAVMGQPKDFLSDDDFIDTDNHNHKTQEDHQARPLKRLYRDPDNRVLGGVCSGLGHYVGIDPVIFRVLLVISFFVFGSGLLLYVLAWLIIPKANTTAEKLEMKGEPVTVSNIGKAVEDQAEKLKSRINNMNQGQGFSTVGQRLAHLLNRLVQLTLQLAALIFKFLAKIIGVILLLIGLFATVPLLMLFTNSEPALSGLSFSSEHFILQSFSPLKELLFNSHLDGLLAQFGLAFITISPLVLLILIGVWLLSGYKAKIKAIAWAAFGTFVLGILMSSFVTLRTVSHFSSVGNVSKSAPLPQSDTLMLNLARTNVPVDLSAINFGSRFAFLKQDSISYLGFVELDIRRSPYDSAFVDITHISRGASSKEAAKRASNINYSFGIENDKLFFDPIFSINNTDKYRQQQVKLIVYLPIGATVYIADELTPLLHDVKNTSLTYDGDMGNKYWTMTIDGLENIPLTEQMKKSANKEYETIKEYRNGKTIIRYRKKTTETEEESDRTTSSAEPEASIHIQPLHFPNPFVILGKLV